MFVCFTEEYTLVLRDLEVVWKSKQFISHGRNKYAHLCGDRLFFVDWNNNLLLLDLKDLLAKIANNTAKNSECRIFDRNVKDVAVSESTQKVYYVKQNTKEKAILFQGDKSFLFRAQSSDATFNTIASDSDFIVAGGYTKPNDTQQVGQGILELFHRKKGFQSSMMYPLTHHHDDQITVIKVFRCFATHFVCSLRFCSLLDLFAIYHGELVKVKTFSTTEETTGTKIWHRDLKIRSISSCRSEIYVVTDQQVLLLALRI